MDRIKESKLKNLSTEALDKILNSLSGPEMAKEPTAEMPLGGMVRIAGIGLVTVDDLKKERETRP